MAYHHHHEPSEGGVAVGTILGIILAIVLALVVIFFVFGANLFDRETTAPPAGGPAISTPVPRVPAPNVQPATTPQPAPAGQATPATAPTGR